MKFSSYTAEDLVLNPEFREWVLNPTPAANAFWGNWLKSHPEKLNEVKEAKKILRKFPLEQYALQEEDVNTIWESLKQGTVNSELDEAREKSYLLNAETVIHRFESKSQVRSNSIWKRTLRYAASLILITAIATWYLNINHIDDPEPHVEIPVAKIEKETQRGQKLTIYLSDGSKVVLNTNSKLIYPEQFSTEGRSVTLEGEAFFEVSKDVNRPFQVKTKDLITTALGTSFNINTRKEGTHVALATGKVIVSSQSTASEVILDPGKEAWYIPDTEKLVTGYFDYDLVMGWKDQAIIFKKASEQEVFSTLENWYDVDIAKTNKPTSPWDYSGEFVKMDLNSVLLSISFSMDFKYTINEQKVTITYQ